MTQQGGLGEHATANLLCFFQHTSLAFGIHAMPQDGILDLITSDARSESLHALDGRAGADDMTLVQILDSLADGSDILAPAKGDVGRGVRQGDGFFHGLVIVDLDVIPAGASSLVLGVASDVVHGRTLAEGVGRTDEVEVLMLLDDTAGEVAEVAVQRGVDGEQGLRVGSVHLVHEEHTALRPRPIEGSLDILAVGVDEAQQFRLMLDGSCEVEGKPQSLGDLSGERGLARASTANEHDILTRSHGEDMLELGMHQPLDLNGVGVGLADFDDAGLGFALGVTQRHLLTDNPANIIDGHALAVGGEDGLDDAVGHALGESLCVHRITDSVDLHPVERGGAGANVHGSHALDGADEHVALVVIEVYDLLVGQGVDLRGGQTPEDEETLVVGAVLFREVAVATLGHVEVQLNSGHLADGLLHLGFRRGVGFVSCVVVHGFVLVYCVVCVGGNGVARPVRINRTIGMLGVWREQATHPFWVTAGNDATQKMENKKAHED